MSGDFEKELLLKIGEISGTVHGIDKKLDNVCKRVEVLENRPARRLETLWQTIVAVLAGLIAGLFSPFIRQ